MQNNDNQRIELDECYKKSMKLALIVGDYIYMKSANKGICDKDDNVYANDNLLNSYVYFYYNEFKEKFKELLPLLNNAPLAEDTQIYIKRSVRRQINKKLNSG